MMNKIFILITALTLGFGNTEGHPFWVVTDKPDLSRAARSVVDENGVVLYHENLASGLNGFWVEAKDLREGDVFIGANGELSVLVSAERVQFDETIKVYNFTVDGNHNYFVIAKCDEFGQTCVLVHNAGQWYHGTDTNSANHIQSHGLDAKTLKAKSHVSNEKGFYVTDKVHDAREYAASKVKNDPGIVLEMDDKDIGRFLMGDGTKNHEAYIPIEFFNQVIPDMIKVKP